MATPKSALQTIKTCNVGAKADASSKIENEIMLTIRVGRLPYLSANTPKISAPKGRITRVQKIASAIFGIPTWKSAAIAFRQTVSKKKSTASSVQPKKHAAKVLLWVEVSDLNSA